MILIGLLIFFGPMIFGPIIKYFIVSLVYFINLRFKYIDISGMYSFKCLCQKLSLLEILSCFIIFIVSGSFFNNTCNPNCNVDKNSYFFEFYNNLFMINNFGNIFSFQLNIYVFMIIMTYILYLFDLKNTIIAHSKRTTWIIFVLWFLIGIIGIAFFQVFVSIGIPFLESIYYK